MFYSNRLPQVLLVLHLCFAFILSPFAQARVWNNTGTGTIVFEEAWTIPELLTATGTLAANLLDIHNQRLTQMDQNGIDYMVLSCASPCIQGISDPAVAKAMAVNVNNQLASQISNNTFRFGAFAALSMHNASEAAAELKRAVQELGFLGGLVNDYQQSGENNAFKLDTLIYYDQPSFDVFWKMVIELDVPALHKNSLQRLSSHILGLCTNGVFDRFPQLKIIVGHLGERIPSDLVRIDTQLLRQLPLGMPMLLNVTTYFHTNLYETTSGNFATPLLQLHIDTIGLDRILYSIDYPFVDIPSGTVWVNGLDEVLSPEDLLNLKRGAAIELLKLNS
ncbi:amidohydrolase 2 [Gymnopus androsaceus JB14]|uniref:Amidohydrolase 2 n=1 Tax=Gymnopus androsaceus JB14 TaxID=1447944 RepID=A0A6A4HCX2_9AGAR|nr:amidohydrolase 2 [Gymnopus androsaceus JB14]